MRRNPSARGIINRQILPALIMGSGAVGNDFLFGLIASRIPGIPPMLLTGPGRHAAKALSAILLGMGASYIVGRRTADQLTAGALTVVGYNVVRDVAARVLPQVPLGEYLQPSGLGYYGAGLNPAYQPMGQYLNDVPGTGVSVPAQLTQGTPYMGPATAWPVQGAEYDESFVYDQ